MKTKEALQAAYDLIGNKKKWTLGAYARDRDGCSIDTRDDEAVSWCAGGAIDKVGGSETSAFCDLGLVCSKKYGRGLSYVNDYLGYATIRRMFRKAIKAA